MGLLFISGCHRSGPLAAVVNGDPISLDDYQQYLQVKPQVEVTVDPTKLRVGPNGIPPQNMACPVVQTIGLQALSDLVERAIIHQMAVDAQAALAPGAPRINPSDDDIKNELNDRTKANPNYVRNFTANGYTLDMIRNDIAMDLASFNLSTQGITVSDKEVNDYIANHPSDFKTVDMNLIVVPDDKTKAKVDADLHSGGDFPTVALKYMPSPNAQTEVHQKVQAIENSIPDLRKVLEPTPQTVAAEGTTTDWIKVQGQWAKFHIIHEAETIDDATKKIVWKGLMKQKGDQGKNLPERIQQRLLGSKIQIMVESLKQPWDAFLANVKANSQSASASASGAPVTGATTPVTH